MDRRVNSEILAEMAARIRMGRELRGWSQQQLADRIGSSESTVSKYEAGDRLPSLDMLLALADALGTTAGRLLAKPERRGRKTEAA